jgi:hypothetical protein
LGTIPAPAGWKRSLADTIATTVKEFAPVMRGIPVVLLALDCQPWHGSLGLSLLTAAEAEADTQLADPAEMAAWRYYDFSAGLVSWQPAALLGRSMRAAYESAPDRRATAESFFRACAEALASPDVAGVVGSLARADEFRMSVAHPDDGREFFPPMDAAEA